MMPPELCQNCGRVIGQLEAAHIHDGGYVVCAECSRRLQSDHTPPRSVDATIILTMAVIIGIIMILGLLGEWAHRIALNNSIGY